ncbi:hypothetical protein vseg_009570 [Gypsophila vaccaria]
MSYEMKKVGMSEDDVCSLLQRYQAATVLSVLREVAQSPEVDINWESLLLRTSSGIKSARELQRLWRHLAYRRPLDDYDGDAAAAAAAAAAADYDSDLDLQLEASPRPSTEAALEAAACVKVLASSPPSDTTTAAATTTTTTTSPLDPDPPPPSIFHKKRKWSADEDSRLLAAVHKWGEGNWSSILKHGHWSRNASQLSQRWSHIRKKQRPLPPPPPPPPPPAAPPPSSSSSTAPLLSEAQLATRRALDMALKDNLTPPPSNAPSKPFSDSPALPLFHLSPPPPATCVPKPRPPMKKPPPKPPSISDTIQRTAVAAGARIVNPSDADALRNYANVHFFRSGTSVPFPNNGNGVLLPKDNPVKPSQPPAALSHPLKSRAMPSASLERTTARSSASVDVHPPKKDDKTCIDPNVPCSEANPMVRPQESVAFLPQTSPKALPMKTQSTSQCATSKGNIASEGKDETSNQVVMDASEDLSASQGNCTPIVNVTHESKSVVDATTENMEGSSQGLAEAK